MAAGQIRTRTQLIAADGAGVGSELPDNSTDLITELVMRDIVASTLNTMSGLIVTTGTTVLSLEHGFVFANAIGGVINLTMPAAAADYLGHKFCIIKTDSSVNAVNLNSQPISGYAAPNSIITQYYATWITCDGSFWYFV